jgi:hypothetical protein
LSESKRSQLLREEKKVLKTSDACAKRVADAVRKKGGNRRQTFMATPGHQEIPIPGDTRE